MNGLIFLQNLFHFCCFLIFLQFVKVFVAILHHLFVTKAEARTVKRFTVVINAGATKFVNGTAQM